MDPKVAARLWEAIRVASKTGVGYDLEIPVSTSRGRSIWIRTIGSSSSPTVDPPGSWEPSRTSRSARPWSRNSPRAARRDKLTGLANRAIFMERLENAVARVKEGAQPYFAVLFLDFDRFKLINDTLGHEAGDELLPSNRQAPGHRTSGLRRPDQRRTRQRHQPLRRRRIPAPHQRPQGPRNTLAGSPSAS